MLETFLTDGRALADTLDADYAQLWRSMDRASRGGKRFRPALVVGSYQALGGRDLALAQHVGEAIELLHTGFVMHDDVIDRDEVRRGELNVSGTFAHRALAAGARDDRAALLGQTAGILAGDLALVGATRMMAQAPADASTVHRLLELLERAVQITAAGELADVRFSLDLEDPTFGEVLTMAEHKTAVYSFELPLQAGAVLAGATHDIAARLSEVGRMVGIAFQLVDDLLGVFGDESVTGKSTLTDLREGKITPLIAYARTTACWPTIAHDVGDPELTPERADHVRGVLESCGARNAIEDLAHGYIATAHSVIADLPVPEQFRTWVAQMTATAVERAA